MKYKSQMLISEDEFKTSFSRRNWLTKQFNDDDLYYELNEFDRIVDRLEKNTDIHVNIRNSFKSLRDKLIEELYSHEACEANDTCYPILLYHFTDIATKLNRGENLTLKQLSNSVELLQSDIANKEPMSKNIFSMAMAVLFGLVLCATVLALGIFGISSVLLGAMITGFGMLGGAVCGSLTGQLFADCITKNRYQMFYQQKEKDLNGVKTEIENVFNSMKDECDIHLYSQSYVSCRA